MTRDILVKPAKIDVDAVLRGIIGWVEIETPSARPDQVNRLQDLIAAELQRLDVPLERVAGREGFGDHLIARYAPPGAAGAPVFVLGHIDTVWPVGTLARRPVSVVGDRVHGPGIYDMKAGSYLAFHALRHLVTTRATTPRPIVMLFNCDEEIGSPTSRALIEQEARACAMALVPEPAVGPQVAAVTSRKGWGRFRMKAFGRPAHAGGNHAEGRSAILEIARQIVALEGMTDAARGITLNVGVVRGGTLLNVVPAEAEIEIDVRVTNEADAARMASVLRGLAPFHPDITISVDGDWNRPPFAKTPAGARLYEAAVGLAQTLGFALPETMRGGVSDGNLTAALGRPTLDGLGCGGHGAHAEEEHILISSIANRAALMINMLGSADFQNSALAG